LRSKAEREARRLRDEHGRLQPTLATRALVEAAGVELRDADFVNVLTAHDF